MPNDKRKQDEGKVYNPDRKNKEGRSINPADVSVVESDEQNKRAIEAEEKARKNPDRKEGFDIG